METLLIALFVIVFVYLIFYMCRGSDECEATPVQQERKLEKSAAVLDEISKLDEKDLNRIRDELLDLKSILEKSQDAGSLGIGESRRAAAGRKAGEEKPSVKKTLRGADKMERNEKERRRASFSKFHVLLLEVFLILIMILMILLKE